MHYLPVCRLTKMLWVTSVGNELTVFSGTNPVSEHGAERPQKPYGLLGMGRGGGVWWLGKRESIYLSLHCHHQNDFCIKMGSDESHFNVSIGSDGQSHKTVSTNHDIFEEKGEPKRYRTEVLPLTSLTPYR